MLLFNLLNLKKMKKRVLLPLLLAGMWATPALASSYVSVSTGFGTLYNSDEKVPGFTLKDAITFQSGVSVGIAAGVQCDNYRVEGAIDRQSNSFDKLYGEPNTGIDFTVLSFMANGYRDFAIKDSSISPYVMAGLGIASVNASNNAGSGGRIDTSVFAWQAGTGIGVKASDNVVIDLGYRYFKAADASSTFGADYTVSGSKFLVGARYGF